MLSPNLCFLLVSNCEPEREIFRQALHRVNDSILCHTAKNGPEAFALLRTTENIPDIIFLDTALSGMSALDCLVKLKQSDGLRKIPVIMYASTAEPDEMALTRSHGALCYCIKPGSVDMLQEALALIAENLDRNLLTAIIQNRHRLICFTPAFWDTANPR